VKSPLKFLNPLVELSQVVFNMDAIKTRFQNLNKDVRGGTVDEYARRVLFSVNDYMK
jgi:hypothetical protein